MKAIISKTIFLVIFAIVLTGNSWSQTPEQLFQKGIMKEEGEGSLKEAIELYKSVADNTNADKVLRAKALYQMGNCYEKLGQQEARNIYEKLVANYTDPQELVANAKRKLNKLNDEKSLSDNSGINMHQITRAEENNGPISPDGKFVICFDWEGAQINVKNLQNSQKWAVSKKGSYRNLDEGFNGDALWSNDSRFVIYAWFRVDNTNNKYICELHVVNNDGSNDRIIKSEYDGYYYPLDWSPDGKYILYASRFEANVDSVNLILYSVGDGKETQITGPKMKGLGGTCHFTADSKYIIFDMPQEPVTFSDRNIYTVPLTGGEITELILFKEMDISPWIIPNTNQVIFFSSHSGVKELWMMTVENGRLIGEPRSIKSGINERSYIGGVLNDGTVLYASYRLNPEFFYARLDFDNNNIVLKNLDIIRNSSRNIIKTIWSPSLSKAAVIIADQFVDPYVKLKMIGYEFKTKTETELTSDLITLPWQPWVEALWTADEKSVLIKAQTKETITNPRGIFKFDFSSDTVGAYVTGHRVFSVMQWRYLQYSPDGKIQYFASLDDVGKPPLKIIARSVESGEEKIITQFDNAPFDWIKQKFFLSPDGKSIAVKYENTLYIIPVDNLSETMKIEELDKNWGTTLGWTNDSKSLLVQKPEGKESWSIWIQPLDGQPAMEGISYDKLKPFFGAGNLMLHHVGSDTYLSMQYGKQIEELWAIENIVPKELSEKK